MKFVSIAVGCVLSVSFLSAHAQTPRFKPLIESEMSAAQRKKRPPATSPAARADA